MWQLLSADNLCKQFGPRSGQTKRQASSGSKLFDTLMVFLEDCFEKLIKKIHRQQKSMQNYPACKEFKVFFCKNINDNFLFSHENACCGYSLEVPPLTSTKMSFHGEMRKKIDVGTPFI